MAQINSIRELFFEKGMSYVEIARTSLVQTQFGGNCRPCIPCIFQQNRPLDPS
ncbi:MAG TPA: hypothetical protein GX529_05220 [Firmicutes bacterium]|nr:hypothetical protein [Candidatus Fermentithermobacillaceae bacterium]